MSTSTKSSSLLLVLWAWACVACSGTSIPDGCIGMGGLCGNDADCKANGRDGWCGEDSRCYQTCHDTSVRRGSDIPRILSFCCDYGTEVPGAAGIGPAEQLPKHWGEPRFKGKRVLVTGGDSGIGFATVQAFYLECAKVLLVGHNAEKSEQASAAIRALGVPKQCSDSSPSVAWAAIDVSDATQVSGLLDQMVHDFGGMDIAVNNAGTAGPKAIQIGDPGFVTPSGDLYDSSIMAVNFEGTLKCMNAEIMHWSASGVPGVMVNVASIAGEISWGGPLYTSSKWAMIGFTKQAALAHADKGIRVNAIAPGAVNTTMLRGGMSPMDPRWIAEVEAMSSSIPLGRIAEPWEMAGPITFLASDMATYITGAVLTADGDVTQARPGSHHADLFLDHAFPAGEILA